jgi:hypothetical protein
MEERKRLYGDVGCFPSLSCYFSVNTVLRVRRYKLLYIGFWDFALLTWGPKNTSEFDFSCPCSAPVLSGDLHVTSIVPAALCGVSTDFVQR